MQLPMDIIFLVGARAAGKTTVGKLLAARLDLPFADTDQFLLRAEGRSVRDIVAAEGWPGFRARESAALRTVVGGLRRGGVVSTGGGIVLAAENRAFLRARGTVFYLHAPAAILAQRLASEPLAAQRPSLTGQSPLEEVAAVLAKRHPLYRETAHHTLDAVLPPDELCTQIADMLRPGDARPPAA